jgi:hypothetical protein
MIVKNDLGAEWHHLAGAFGKGCQAPEEATACVNPSQKGGVALCV